MTDFDAFVYLDVDTLVLDDISHLHEIRVRGCRGQLVWQCLQRILTFGRDFKIVHFTLVKPFLKKSNSAYEIPMKLYKEVGNDYMNSSVTRRIQIKCI